MTGNLEVFHGVKDVFVNPDIEVLVKDEDHFNNMLKIHMLSHYVHSIRELGVLDGYNTEATERLHIDYMKIPWWDSNHVNPTQQMATYLQCKELWVLLCLYLHDTGQLLDPRFDPVDMANNDAKEEEEIEYGVEGELDDIEEGSDEQEM
ncbi:hypothetical protein FRC08_007972, partial [Ceratobasidium sp. 394]